MFDRVMIKTPLNLVDHLVEHNNPLLKPYLFVFVHELKIT